MSILLVFLFITISVADNLKYQLENNILIISGNGTINQIMNETYQSETKEIIIQNGIIEIGKGAFGNWNNLKKITISSTIKIIGKRAFAQCEKLETIIFDENSKVEEIEDFAFQDCINLKEIKLPNSIKRINFNKVFDGCDNIKEITIDENNDYYTDNDNNVIYDSNKTKVIYYPRGIKKKTYDIDDDIVEISERTFEGSMIETIHHL